MADAPYVIVKHRHATQYKRSIKIQRNWKHKETGNVVMVVTVQNVVPDNYLRIVFFDPQIGRELSMPMKKRIHPFQPPGAAETLYEPGFEDQYEPYTAFSTRV
jgi:hypothetical protein